jgi:D-amino peptidase
VKAGRGASTISMSPAAAQEAIMNGVEKSLLGDLKQCLITPPSRCILDVTYVTPDLAYEKSFYPGVKHIGNRTNRIETDNFFDVMRAMRFIK